MKPKLGVSECLLGVECRYDGGHKRDRFITDKLLKYFEFIPICPENSILGTPRESMRLVLKDEKIEAIGNKTQENYTPVLKKFSNLAIDRLKDEEICGYILKAKSPSCGLNRVKVYLENSMPSTQTSSGVFAKELQESFQTLPIEDEGRLNDSWLRENFIMQVFAYSDLQKLQKEGKKIGDIVKFHSNYKFLLMSKSVDKYYKIGRVVGNHNKLNFNELLSSYSRLFLEIIAEKSTIKKSLNVLHHMFGFFSKELTQAEKVEVLNSFDEFKDRVVPLIVPIKIVRLYIQKYNITYLKSQKYLQPYPYELSLRSDIDSLK